ncbi:YibE/F family protein [Aminobacterium sp. UBA4834]|uniref:YibE/F family protein n=2 Tax=Aminobacterium TaxID=81466 RepID=UPI00257BC63F|nr:YibE/F family protein [Aminobacterium sp. UBA4834]
MTHNVRMYCLTFILVPLFAIITAFSADKIVLNSWNTEESVIVRIDRVGSIRSTEAPLSFNGGEQESPSQETSPEEAPWLTEYIDVTVTFLNGDDKGTSKDLLITQLSTSSLELHPKRRYLLVSDRFEDNTIQYSISDRYRVPWVVAFLILACAGLIASAGKAGVRALAGLLLSLAVLLGWYIPALANGIPPVPFAILAIGAVSSVTVLLVVRRPAFWIVAFLGALGGAIAASTVGWSMVTLWELSGLASDSASLLASTIPNLSMEGLLLSAVMIGSIGAVLDVAVSVTSTLAEMFSYDPKIPGPRLWQAGIGVGREVLGSMINTLILAYLGSALPLTILITSSGADPLALINDPYIAQELVRSVAGTIGLLLTIPITTAVCVWWLDFRLRRSKEKKKEATS